MKYTFLVADTARCRNGDIPRSPSFFVKWVILEAITKELKMKLGIKIAVLVCVAMTLTSCFDIYQQITATDAKNVHVYTQVSLLKSIFEVANEMGDEPEELDYEAFMGEFSAESFSEYTELGIQTKPINTITDFGYIVEYDFLKNNPAHNSYITDKKISLIPAIIKDTIIIDVDFTGSTFDPAETDEYTQFFLRMARYRISIDKSVKPTINEAFLFLDGTNIPLHANDYGNGFLLDIPLYLVFSTKGQIIIK